MRRRTLLIAALAIILLGYILWGCLAYWRAEQLGIRRIDALLAGNANVHLESFELLYQQRRVHCSDPEALRYLEGCLRDGDQHPDLEGGLKYRLVLRFAGGGTLDTTTFWSETGFQLYMPYQETDTGEKATVKVNFKPPVPKAVAEMMAFLDRPWREVKGVVLVIEPGGIRREFDRSLVNE